MGTNLGKASLRMCQQPPSSTPGLQSRAMHGPNTSWSVLRLWARRHKGCDKSHRAYARAAEQGHARAQYNLGVCCDFGKGVTKDETKAAELFAKGAHAHAQYNLGVRYEVGKGVTK